MQTSLRGIAHRAMSHKGHRFRNLYGLLNEENLLWCWRFLKKDAAPGADHVDYRTYEENLEANISDLVERLKRKRYRAKLVRRRYIPKPNGKTRPLGIPATEDKLLQLAVAKILEAIFEADFLDCSFGYRPNRSPKEAAKRLNNELHYGRYNWVVDADIQGFFDNISHDWMIRMLEERIDDEPFIRLIRKWLKAGILEPDGQVRRPDLGTPQGGIVSPLLANLYLHYALDLWFERRVGPRCRGKALLIRFADDFVCAFRLRSEAEAFFEALVGRLDKFGLALAPDKTHIIRFCRSDISGSGRFDFLGFEYSWARTRSGRPGVKRRTSRKKLRASLEAFSDWIKRTRSTPVSRLMRTLKAKYRGYYTYYGVVGNSESLAAFFYCSKRILFKWLNRRSQRRSYSWVGFQALLDTFGIEGPNLSAL